MALLPTGIIVVPTGADKQITPVEVIGGVVVGITAATDTAVGNPVTETFPFFEQAAVEPGTNAPLESTSTNSAYNATTAISSTGTFAYNQVQFLIRNHASEINGSASNSLLINGNSQHLAKNYVSNSAKGARTSTAFRAGDWRPLGIAGQRTNWATPPTSNDTAFVLTTNNASDAVDQAQFVTYMAVPGELTYRDGSPNPIQDEYVGNNGAE